ncbi:hypothetical protein [Longibaculum muris]|uniref:hypothetical protein n=1 Tax=Longibaculum muris TaxID=1796628 RepID=UPI00189D8A90|nr:hypothetical protein [Longibaculum muris]
MIKKKYISITVVFCMIVFLFIGLTGCGKSNNLVGSWVSEGDDLVKFENNGSCSAPFTYNAAWIESADSYTIKDDGTLVFSSTGGHANSSYKLVDSEEEALKDRHTYYISGDTLIIRREKYEKVD